jgi:hypothetical protein
VYSSVRSTEKIPDTIQVFENFHNRYDEWFTRHQWVYRSEIEAVSRLIPQGGLGLEVGVGTGRFAAPFAVAVGLDPSIAMASIAKKKGSEILMFVFSEFTEPRKRQGLKIEIGFGGSLRELFDRGTRLKSWILFASLSSVPRYMATMVYVPFFAAEIKHADAFVLGGMAMASMVMPLLLSIPLGRLADRIGRKKVQYLTILIYCLSLPLLVYAVDSTMLLFSGVLQGFSVLAAVTRGAITAELVPIALLGRKFGILGLFRGLVMILAPVAGGVLWNVIGPESIFYVILVLQVLGMFLLLMMPETLIKKSRTSRSRSNSMRDSSRDVVKEF